MTFQRMTATTDGGDDDDGDRVDHRRLDLLLQLDVLLDVDRQPLEDGVEDAARLTGRDHVGVERVEDLRVPLHRIGERRAALDVGPRLEDDLREVLVLLLVAEDVEALHQRQAGVDHDGELPREDGQVLRVDAAALRLAGRLRLGLRLRGGDLRDEDLVAAERDACRLEGVGDALAAHRFTAACPTGVCEGGHWFDSRLSTFDFGFRLSTLTLDSRGYRRTGGLAPGGGAVPGPLPRPAPETTPTPRLIMSISSSL